MDADVIVLGSATSIDPAGLQQVLDAVEPDGYVVKVLADHPTIGAIAVRRTVLSATWLQHLVEAVTSGLAGIMAPDLLWVGSVAIEIEAQTVVEASDPQEGA